MTSVPKEWIELTIQTKDELIDPLTELLRKYSGYSLEGYCHLDDGTGDYARHIPKKKSDEKT